MTLHLKFSLFLVIIYTTCSLITLKSVAAQNDTSKITLSQVLVSSAENFPAIRGAIATIEAARGNKVAAQGAFDAELNNTTYERFRGFYSGDFNETEIVKPFQDFNAEIAVGYRRSDGDFPIYQDYFFTNRDGEISLRVAFSLLRDRDFDSDRFKLAQSELKLDEAVIESLVTKLDVQNQAIAAYLNWLTAGKSYLVYDDLLKIALNRESALKKRVSNGDLAEIAVVENQQFILQRREILASAERDLKNAANRLSLFLRDEAGDPFIPTLKNMPKKFPDIATSIPENIQNEVARVTGISPQVKKIENRLEQAENEIRLGENSLKPRVDVELYNAEDFGFGEFGSETREGFESTVTLNVSVPLQRRLGRGQIAKGQALKKQLLLEKALQKEQIRVSLENLVNNIETAQEIVGLTSKEREVTRRMEEAERIKFKSGRSDFFLVNIREVNTANAKIKNIAAQKNFVEAISNFQVATVDFDSLYISPIGSIVEPSTSQTAE